MMLTDWLASRYMSNPYQKNAVFRVPGMVNSELENVFPFGLPAVSQKLRAYNIIRVMNIIKSKLYDMIKHFYNVL